MIIDLIAIKNIVERNLRDFKIGAWALNPPDTGDPTTRVKPENEQDQYTFNEIKMFDAQSNIINWTKFDNKIDFIKALAQIIHDIMVDTASDPIDKTTTPGKKTITTNSDGTTTEVISGNVYTSGGSKIPVSEELVLGSKLSPVVHFKNGTVGPTVVKLDGLQILTTRQAAIPNGADPTVNAILTALRNHGLIAP